MGYTRLMPNLYLGPRTFYLCPIWNENPCIFFFFLVVSFWWFKTFSNNPLCYNFHPSSLIDMAQSKGAMCQFICLKKLNLRNLKKLNLKNKKFFSNKNHLKKKEFLATNRVLKYPHGEPTSSI